jgi:tryptophan-rich sensory protein
MQIGSIRLSKLLFAIIISVAFVVLGDQLTGDALGTWYLELKQPWFSFPLWVGTL